MSVSLEHLPALLSITHRVLSRKVLVFTTLIMTFSLFCWAMAMGHIIHLTIAATFAVLVFLFVLLRKESVDEQAT